MEMFDVTQILQGLDFDPRLVAALVAIVSILKRIWASLTDKYAELTAFIVAQILAFGQWIADIIPVIPEAGLAFLSGIAIWLAGKVGYKGFKKFMDSQSFSDDRDEVVVTKKDARSNKSRKGK